MLKENRWTEEEVNRLRRFYTSSDAFGEILKAFPNRTENAIRIKASRLGLKRPDIFYGSPNPSILLGIKKGDKRYLVRCCDCGEWIQIKSSKNKIIECSFCGALHPFNP
mgnify:CR=1 FL=1